MKRHLHSISNHEADSTVKVTDIDETLRGLETEAWDVYHKAVQELAIAEPTGALDKFLTAHILPGFSKLGFTDDVSRSILCIAAGAWKALAAVPDQVVRLHPHMRKDLDEVRQGLLIQADRRMASDFESIYLTPQASYDAARQSMDPANLYRVLEEISTPWIILPRAYNALQSDHAHYLPAYLEMIENETNEEALHIFTRIAIEFLANFSIRFADNTHANDQAVQLVTAVYRAMYWKSLRSPPRGFEDVHLFDHYLSWLKHSDGRSINPDFESGTVVKTMDRYRDYIFPRRLKDQQDPPRSPDRYRFLVALRHGCLGIDSSVRYFASKPSDVGVPFDKGMAWGAFLFDLKSLFDQLLARYPAESKRTQYHIREFIFQLENAYEYILLEGSGTDPKASESLNFVHAKITGMILQLNHDLALSL